MARLNTANPLVNEAARRKTGLKDQSHKCTHTSPRKETHTPGHPPKASAKSHKKSTSTIFDILPDNDATEEGVKLVQEHGSPFMSPTTQKKKRTLKAAQVNSLLLPFQQGPRQRPAIKVETDDYEKENDIIEDSTGTFETTRESVSQRTPPRRVMPGTPTRSRPDDRPLSPVSPQTESAGEDCGDSSFNSLDDFIVSDNDEPSYNETSDSETEVEKNSTPSPPPKSTRRRLMRGRKPDRSMGETGHECSVVNGPFFLNPKVPDSVKSSAVKDSPRHLFQDDLHLSTKLNELRIDDNNATSSQLETDLTRSIMEPDPSPAQAYMPDNRLLTPMENDSPYSSRTFPPSLGNMHISPTPNRSSTDAFWSQTSANELVDYHSPRKLQGLGTSVTELLREFDDTETEPRSHDSAEPELWPKMVTKAPPAPKTPSKTAMKKEEAAKKRAEKERRAEFDNNKARFAKAIIKALDLAMTGGKVLNCTKSTGGVPVVWSRALQKTAGRTFYKGEREMVRSESGEGPDVCIVRHKCRIELAERIITDEYRLLNTLAHEFCHVLNFVISNVQDKPHGANFHAWGRKCVQAMEDHPLYGGGQIEITTRHSYEIEYKYVWSCEGCIVEICRQTKSVDPERQRCGRCAGTLKQIKPKPRNVSPEKKAGALKDL